MKPRDVHIGINRRDLDEEFLRLGGEIRILRGTGDVSYSHPALSARSKRANCRRKDAPRELVHYVKRVLAALEK